MRKKSNIYFWLIQKLNHVRKNSRNKYDLRYYQPGNVLTILEDLNVKSSSVEASLSFLTSQKWHSFVLRSKCSDNSFPSIFRMSQQDLKVSTTTSAQPNISTRSKRICQRSSCTYQQISLTNKYHFMLDTLDINSLALNS